MRSVLRAQKHKLLLSLGLPRPASPGPAREAYIVPPNLAGFRKGRGMEKEIRRQRKRRKGESEWRSFRNAPFMF